MYKMCLYILIRCKDIRRSGPWFMKYFVFKSEKVVAFYLAPSQVIWEERQPIRGGGWIFEGCDGQINRH